MKDQLKISLIIIVLISSNLFSQDKRFNNWFISNSVGFLEFQQDNVYKTTSNVYAFNFGKEFSVSKQASLLLSVRAESIYGDYNASGNSYHYNSKFVSIPFSVRGYLSKDTPSTLYGEIGIENKLKVFEKIENTILNIETKGQKGYHLGVLAGFGYRTKVHDQLDFLVGVDYRGDMLQSGYDNNKTKLNNNVNLSIAFEIYKKEKN